MSQTGYLSDELIIIDNLIAEHAAIRGHLKSVCSLMDNWEDLTVPEPGQMEAANSRYINLRETMAYFHDGLKKHQAHEKDVMLSLIGNPLYEAIEIEHKEILKQIGEVNFVLVNINAEGFIANGAYLREIVDNLCHLVNTHNEKEDTILRLLKRRYI